MDKNIFLLWLQGWDKAPWLQKKVLNSWAINNPDWNIELVDEKNLISLIFGGLIFTNIFLLCIGFFATNLFAKVTSISKKRLGCFVMILIIIGTYSYSNYGAHVLMALILGFLGYIFIKVNIPPIPIVLGFVMSPIIEQNLNRALTIHNGDLTNVLFRPITLTILFLALITIIYGVTTRR